MLRRGPTQQGVDAKRVLYVDQNADRWVDGGDLFHGKDGLEKGSSGTTVLDGDFDAHQAEIEELRNQLGVKVLLFVHGADQGRDIFLRKLADGRAKELFIFRKQGERRGGLRCKNRICHGNKATVEMACLSSKAQEHFHFWSLCSNRCTVAAFAQEKPRLCLQGQMRRGNGEKPGHASCAPGMEVMQNRGTAVHDG